MKKWNSFRSGALIAAILTLILFTLALIASEIPDAESTLIVFIRLHLFDTWKLVFFGLLATLLFEGFGDWVDTAKKQKDYIGVLMVNQLNKSGEDVPEEYMNDLYKSINSADNEGEE